jgi:hypothetical protein
MSAGLSQERRRLTCLALGWLVQSAKVEQKEPAWKHWLFLVGTIFVNYFPLTITVFGTISLSISLQYNMQAFSLLV